MAFYPAIPASDGTSMEARENSEFQVFEVYDTTRSTPLRLQTTAGTNAAPLVTTAQGVVPPVEVVSPNVSHVFKSGEWEWRRDSFDGAEVAVKEARNAAGVAASSSATAAQSSEKSAQAAQSAIAVATSAEQRAEASAQAAERAAAAAAGAAGGVAITSDPENPGLYYVAAGGQITPDPANPGLYIVGA